MNIAIIWTDLAESNIPLNSSWRELKEGGGEFSLGWGSTCALCLNFKTGRFIYFSNSFCRCRSFNPSLRRCC